MLAVLLTGAMCLGAPATKGPAKTETPKAKETVGTVYTPPCKAGADDYCTDKALYVDLDQGRDIYLRLNTAIGDVVSLMFPEGVVFPVPPTVGNKAVYKLEARDHALDLFVKHPNPRVRVEEVYGHRTVIQIDAKGGARTWHVTLDVMVAPESRAVRAVSFRSEKLAGEETYVRERITQATAALKKEVEDSKAEVRQTALNMSYEMTTGMYAQGNACSDSHTKAARMGGIWGHVLEVCRTGERLFVRFELRNGTRERFQIGAVDLVRGTDAEGSEAAVDSIVRFWDSARGEAVGEMTLAHRQTVQAAISSEASEETDKWALRIVEAGGGGRTLVVDGLRF